MTPPGGARSTAGACFGLRGELLPTGNVAGAADGLQVTGFPIFEGEWIRRKCLRGEVVGDVEGGGHGKTRGRVFFRVVQEENAVDHRAGEAPEFKHIGGDLSRAGLKSLAQARGQGGFGLARAVARGLELVREIVNKNEAPRFVQQARQKGFFAGLVRQFHLRGRGIGPGRPFPSSGPTPAANQFPDV